MQKASIIPSCLNVARSEIKGYLKGILFLFLEDQEKNPILFTILTENTLLVYMRDPNREVKGFIKESIEIINKTAPDFPLYIFKYDELLLVKYHQRFDDLKIKEWYFSRKKEVLGDYKTLDSLFGYISHDHYQNGFYRSSWYPEFCYDASIGSKIIKFAEGVLFNKLTILIC